MTLDAAVRFLNHLRESKGWGNLPLFTPRQGPPADGVPREVHIVAIDPIIDRQTGHPSALLIDLRTEVR